MIWLLVAAVLYGPDRDTRAVEAVRAAFGPRPLHEFSRGFMTAVYDRHPNGSARTIVCVDEDMEGGRGEMCVARLTPSARVVAMQKLALPYPPERLELYDFHGDARDEVLLHYHNLARNPVIGVFRMRGERLHEIAEFSAYWDFLDIDLDRDGTPELIETGCCDHRGCGVTGIWIGVLRWNGRRYVHRGEKFVDAFVGVPGTVEREVALQQGGRFVMHVVNGDRDIPPVRSATIRDNGNTLLTIGPGTRVTKIPITLGDECHVFQIEAEGPPWSEVRFYLGER